MAANTFKEDKESFWATFRTKWGWISFVLGNLIYGYAILNYIEDIENFILGILSGIPSFLIAPLSWIVFGIISSIIGYMILLVVEQVVKFSKIKNRRIF